MLFLIGLLMVISGINVITTRNTMHGVFNLVMCFVNAAVMMIMWGVDYLGLMLIIVYVGAIAILFLFVVMMINLKTEESNRTRYVPIGIIAMMIMMGEVYGNMTEIREVGEEYYKYKVNGGETNIKMMGDIIFTWPFLLYGAIVLMVAMVGAIVLTISHTRDGKYQDVYQKWGV